MHHEVKINYNIIFIVLYQVFQFITLTKKLNLMKYKYFGFGCYLENYILKH